MKTISLLKKSILAIALTSAVTSSCLGATFRWASGVFGGTTDDWATAANWYEGGATLNTPGALDVVTISDDLFANPVTPMPNITSDVGSITQLVLGQTTAGQLSLSGADGKLVVSGAAYIGNLGTGTLSLSGNSFFQTGNLVFGNQSITGAVDLSGSSLLRAGNLTYLNSDTASTITLSDTSTFRFNGDQTLAGLENTRIVASVGTITAVYNSEFNFTDYTVIPEPGTYALLAGCLVLTSVMVRRRR
jgi:hypothetical protein